MQVWIGGRSPWLYQNDTAEACAAVFNGGNSFNDRNLLGCERVNFRSVIISPLLAGLNEPVVEHGHSISK